jgi:hypothetical protein
MEFIRSPVESRPRAADVGQEGSFVVPSKMRTAPSGWQRPENYPAGKPFGMVGRSRGLVGVKYLTRR